MSGRTPAQAVQEYLQPLQRSVSCVTPGILDVRGGYYVAQHAHTLALANGDPIPLHGDSHLLLTIIQSYRIIEAISARGPYQVLITGYSYSLDDSNGREILSFQWHPQSRSPITFPHLHLGAGAEIGRSELARSHIPTGRIAIEHVLRLAIEDLSVDPIRDDWDTVLTAGQAVFEEWNAG